MAPAPPDAVRTGDVPRRDASVNPNLLDSLQRTIIRDSIPVRTLPFNGSSSPIRSHSMRRAAEKRTRTLSANPFAPLVVEDQESDDTFADTEILIAEAQDQLNTRASILRVYSQAITKCDTENASHAPPPGKTVTFAGVASAAHATQPGNQIITPRRRPRPLRNDKRVLIRLRKDSTFFDKGLQIQLAIRDKLHLQLADVLNIKQTNTGFAILPRTTEIQQKILQNQQQWGPLVGLEIAEKDTEWHTYLIKNFPRTITSWDGTELDYKSTVEEAIKEQTGLRPVQWRSTDTGTPTPTLVIHFDQPLKSRFRLLGLGDLSFQLTRPRRLMLCETCWLFHPPTQCQKPKVCGNCGSSSHDRADCEAHPKCVGCYGPHSSGSPECFALLKRTAHGSRALSKTEHSFAIQQGKAAYERWELFQQRTQPADATQAYMADQEAPDTDMAEAGNLTPDVAEQRDTLPDEGNANNVEETDLLKGNMDTTVEAEEEEEDGEETEEEEEEEEEEDEGNTELPRLPHPPTEPSIEQNTARQLYGTIMTSTATSKQPAIKAAVLRRVQVNPVELLSDTVIVAHSPPSSPAQQSPLKKTRQTRLTIYGRK
ncbi:hypothetical protein V8C37DRAFT_414796 [Trichoderma ceciliae]